MSIEKQIFISAGIVAIMCFFVFAFITYEKQQERTKLINESNFIIVRSAAMVFYTDTYEQKNGCVIFDDQQICGNYIIRKLKK